MENRKSIILRSVLYLLLFLFPIATYSIPHCFLTYHLVEIYLIFISAIYIRYIYENVAVGGLLKRNLMSIAILMLFWFCARFAKYKLFHEAETIKRFCWYLYYIPMLCIPLFTLFASINIDKRENTRINKNFYWMFAITILLIMGILTNDYHQLAFVFNDGFVGWDSDYSHGFLWYFAIIWEYGLYLASFVIVLIKCRITDLKKYAWITLIPWCIGIMLIIMEQLDLKRINGLVVIDVTTVIVFMIAIYLDACMQIGFIPINRSYRKIFSISSLSAMITNENGKPIYATPTAVLPKEEWISGPDTIAEGDMLIQKAKIRNGYGFWQQDVSQINRVNEELADIREQLKEEGELSRLNNDLKERQAKIESRTALYSKISERTGIQAALIIEEISKLNSDSSAEDINRVEERICIYGAYIKRYANLMLLSENNPYISIMELGLSMLESLRYLDNYGIYGECVGNSTVELKNNQALIIYEIFEGLIEDNLDRISAVYVKILEDGTIKINLEGVYVELSSEMLMKLDENEIGIKILHEDQASYVRIFTGKETD